MFGTKLGTTGFGLVAGIDFSKHVAVRAQVSYAEVKDFFPILGDSVSIDLKLSNQALLVDFHPFVNSFKLSAGVFSNHNELSTRAHGERLTFNERDYNAEIDIELGFGPISPYVGFGFSSGRGRAGYGFSLEGGVLIQGEGEVNAFGQVHGGGPGNNACQFRIENGVVSTEMSPNCTSRFPNLAEDMEVETRDLEELESPANLNVYPVVELGVTYRF